MDSASKDSSLQSAGESPMRRPSSMEEHPMRNPSPPSADLLAGEDKSLLEADTINNTVFSKHWVFSILMKLLEQVESEAVSKGSQDSSQVAEACGIDIDEDLENDLCRLWDMTANVEVSKFLQEWKSSEIFLSVMSKTNAPRITEISMGVLGNMACCPAIRKEFSKNQQLIDLCFGLMSGSDSPTMVETSRLIYTCLNDEECVSKWLETIQKDGSVLRSVTFILQSSTNSDLIHNVADLLDQLLDLDDELLETWSSPVLIQAITEALHQVSSNKPDTVSLLLHSLQVISTTDSGVNSLVESCERIQPLLTTFISGVFEDGVITLRGKENTLASTISVLCVLVLRSVSAVTLLTNKDNTTIKGLAEMFALLHRRTKSSDGITKTSNQKVISGNHHGDKAEAEEKTSEDSDDDNDNDDNDDGGHGVHDEGDDDDDEEEKEKIWLTELLKDQLIDFFCCTLEVGKKNDKLLKKFTECCQETLTSLRESLPEDRNDLMDLMESFQKTK